MRKIVARLVVFQVLSIASRKSISLAIDGILCAPNLNSAAENKFSAAVNYSQAASFKRENTTSDAILQEFFLV